MLVSSSHPQLHQQSRRAENSGDGQLQIHPVAGRHPGDVGGHAAPQPAAGGGALPAGGGGERSVRVETRGGGLVGPGSRPASVFPSGVIID